MTRPGIGALSGPAELDTVIAELSYLAARLPQLLGQLAGWLNAQQRAGRLRIDDCSQHPDPAAAVTAAIEDLTRASGSAGHAGHALDAAHQTLAHLAVRDQRDQERRPR